MLAVVMSKRAATTGFFFYSNQRGLPATFTAAAAKSFGPGARLSQFRANGRGLSDDARYDPLFPKQGFNRPRAFDERALSRWRLQRLRQVADLITGAAASDAGRMRSPETAQANKPFVIEHG